MDCKCKRSNSECTGGRLADLDVIERAKVTLHWLAHGRDVGEAVDEVVELQRAVLSYQERLQNAERQNYSLGVHLKEALGARSPRGTAFRMGDAVEALGAPFADLAAGPNPTPSTMIGALRFLLLPAALQQGPRSPCLPLSSFLPLFCQQFPQPVVLQRKRQQESLCIVWTASVDNGQQILQRPYQHLA